MCTSTGDGEQTIGKILIKNGFIYGSQVAELVRRIIPYDVGRRIRSLGDTSYRFESCPDYKRLLDSW